MKSFRKSVRSLKMVGVGHWITMMLDSHSMRRLGFWILATLLTLGATIPKSYAQGGGPPGGTIFALAIDPSNTATVYAGTAAAGIFKSSDGGGSWSAINVGLTALTNRAGFVGVNALAIDPVSPATVYAGTGGGVVKSINGGASWNTLNFPQPGGVVALAIDPANPATIYAGTTGGILKSTNGGASWVTVDVGLTAATGNIWRNALVIDPVNPATLYAGSGGGGVVKSINGGASWNPINSGLPGGVTALAIDPVSPATLYAGSSSSTGTVGGVYKSTNGGTTWSPVNSGLTTPVVALAIDRTNSATIYAGPGTGGIFKSSNGGASWSPINTGLYCPGVGTLAIDPSNGANLYAGTVSGIFKSNNGGTNWINIGLPISDVQALAIDPVTSGTLYAATDLSLVFKSSNGGASWYPSNTGLPGGAYGLVIDPTNPATVYAAAGGVFKSSNSGASWTAMNSGITSSGVFTVAIDPANSSNLYAGTPGGVFKSINGGASWSASNTGLPTSTGEAEIFSLAIDPAHPTTIYAVARPGGFFRSSNAGASWSKSDTGLPARNLWSVAIDPATPNTLYVATQGGVFKSYNGGTSWIRTGDIGPAFTPDIAALAIDPMNSATVYTATQFGQGGVFKSGDGGGIWTPVNTGLPNGFVIKALAIDPSTSGTLYVGTDGRGVFKSTDGAATWQPIGAGTNNTLNVAPTSLSFNAQVGSSPPPTQTLSITSSSSGIAYTITTATSSGGNWLSASPSAGNTPQIVNVSVNPAVIATAGTYSGTVTVTAAGTANNPVTIPVTLAVTNAGSNSLIVSPSFLTFAYQSGGSVPPAQSLSLTATGSSLSYTAAVTAGAMWLQVSNGSGTTPGSPSVSVSPASLSAGTYNGTITVTATGAVNSPVTVPVTLTVGNSSQPQLTVSPSSFNFSGYVGSYVPSQTLTITTSNGSVVPYTIQAATNSGGNWLSAMHQGSGPRNTPSGENIWIDSIVVTAGTYTGTLTVMAPATSNGTIVIPVTFTAAQNTISASPSALSFSSELGVTPVITQNLSITSTGNNLGFTIQTATSSGGNWLAAAFPGTSTNSTPSTVLVHVNPAVPMAQGTYNGTVTVTAIGAVTNSPIRIPVTFTATNNTLSVSPSSLSFNAQVGGSPPPNQAVSITGAGSGLAYTISTATTSGGNWLSATVNATKTPALATVSVNPAGIPTAGTYNGTVTITAAGTSNSPVTIPVTFTVASAGSNSLTVSPSSMSFSYQPGGSAPAAQFLGVSTTNSSVSYTAVVSAGAAWLQVSSGSGVTPGIPSVSVNPVTLAMGIYNGAITVTAAGAINSPMTVPVTLTVGNTGPTYNIPNRGGVSLTTSGIPATTVTGYGAVVPNSGSATPAGVAIFAYRQNGIVVSEAGVPASPLIQSARIYAEINSVVNTGIAIANPNSQDAAISFFFTDLNGQNFGSGTTTIPAGSQRARFLTEPPFNGGASLQGTLTLTSSVPVTVIALRGFTNERKEFLMTTLPVAGISSSSTGLAVLPHFADGGGWTTSLVLTNTTDTDIAGSIRFFNGDGSVATLTLGSSTSNIFFYSIPARSSQKLVTAGAGSETTSGSVRITPISGQETPSALAVFSYKTGGVTVSEASVTASDGSAFDLYVESSGVLGTIDSLQSGIALANASSSAVTVNLELTALDGTPTGLTTNITVAGQGQIAKFLGQLFPGAPSPFRGVLRVSNGAGNISMIGLRARYNERGEFLITTTQPLNEGSGLSNAPLFFPHIADGGGYATQFFLFGMPGQSLSGTLQVSSPSGQILNSPLQ